MGDAISAVMNPVGVIGNTIGGAAGSAIGGVAGGAIDGIVRPIPNVDQTKINDYLNYLQNQSQTAGGIARDLYGQGTQQTNAAQQAIQQAGDFTRGGNVSAAQALLAQTAQGGGPAQQAAAAQLQAGMDQGIQMQHSMANSGNLSQMLGGQRAAMQNAAMLAQQKSNAAAQLQAQMAAGAQGAYANAALGQAGLNQQNAQAQAALAGQTLNAAGTAQGQAIGGMGQAAQGAQNQAQMQQDVANRDAQNRINAMGGMMNAAGSIAGAMLAYGGKVKGEASSTDSLKNDKVPTLLSAGEVVIPNSALKDHKSAHEFLDKILKGKGPKQKTVDMKEFFTRLADRK